MKLAAKIALLSITLLYACTTPEVKKQKTITVSVAPQKYFVDAISNGLIHVNILVPIGAGPDNYEPSPQQIAELHNSKAYIEIGGLGFELAWMSKIQEQNPQLKIFRDDIGIMLENEDEHNKNPHIWMSAKQCKAIAKNTYEALLASFPEYKDTFDLHLSQLEIELDSIDQLYSKTLAPFQNKSFMIFHPALHYMAKDYGLNELAIEENGKEPSPSHLIDMANKAKQESIGIIFIQKEFDIENAQVIAKETGAKVVQINPLDEDWKAQQLSILSLLAQNLK
jgi:zinc transport system substrate-binding protein